MDQMSDLVTLPFSRAGRYGGLMVSAPDSGLSGRCTVLLSWSRHCTLTVPLHAGPGCSKHNLAIPG